MTVSDERLLELFCQPGTTRTQALRAVADAAAAEQLERCAEVPGQLYPLGSLVLGDAPSRIERAIRALGGGSR